MLDKNLVTTITSDVFDHPFNEDKFKELNRQILKKMVDDNYLLPNVWQQYNEYVDSCKRVGKFTDKKGRKIDLLVVKLKKSTSRDRARTMQRNFVAKFIKTGSKDGALVAFYGDDPSDWRYSFVKMEYDLKLGEIFTPAKRFSFLVGSNEYSHTAKSRVVQLLQLEEAPTFDELEDAFSVEKVAKEFFEKYKELHGEVYDEIVRLTNSDKKLKEDFEKTTLKPEDFAKRLLGQIVFLYFLEKKGWLGVRKDSSGNFGQWGSGSKKFLRELYNKKDYKNFFNDVLEPLFYESLAKERDNDYYKQLDCKIPFLNGGLFEPINDYDWTGTDVFIDNAVFERIFDVFDQYNFTVKEDEPLEKEVAVDPEMLGKVFERLLEVKDRKSKGAFYTPREIVHYMCQQSLINYLKTNTKIERKDIETLIYTGEMTVPNAIRHLEKLSRKLISDVEKSFLLPDSIVENAKLIDKLLVDIKVADPAVGSGAFLVGMMTEIVKARYSITPYFSKSEQIERNAYDLKRDCIEKALHGVDIEPSAVDIAKLRLWLSLIVDEDDPSKIKPLPNLDYKIMCGNSLLEEFEGVKLFNEKLLGETNTKGQEKEKLKEQERVLQEELGQIIVGKKLDNGRQIEIKKELKKIDKDLEKLSAMIDTSEQTGLWSQTTIKKSKEKFAELQKLHTEFFNEANRKKKKYLSDRINQLEWEFIEETLKEQGNEQATKKLEQYKSTKAKPFFLWKLNFSDVFRRKNPGFDIVIANPPYIRQEEIKEYKPALMKYFVFESMADLYTYFYEKSVSVLKKSGSLCFISSNKFMRARYGKKLRQFIRDSTHLIEIVDFGERHVFEAITNTTIVMLKNESIQNGVFCYKNELYAQKNEEILFSQNELSPEAWSIANKDVLLIKEKMEAKGESLSKWHINIYRGLLTGFNEAFIIDEKTKEYFCSQNLQCKRFIHPVLRGRDISKYLHRKSGLFVIVIPKGWTNANRGSSEPEAFFKKQFPIIHSHLLKIEKEYESRKLPDSKGLFKRDDQGDYWWELRSCDYCDQFSKEKIVWIELSDKNKFSFSRDEEYLLAGAFFITGENLKYLLSYLNSNICLFYFKLICNSSGMGTIQWKKFVLDRMPVPHLHEKEEKPFVQAVERILSITASIDFLSSKEKQSKVRDIESEINDLIYKLYDLTPKEIKLVEESVVHE